MPGVAAGARGTGDQALVGHVRSASDQERVCETLPRNSPTG